MDVTHVKRLHYLTLIDCGPTQFAVWRRLQRQDTDSVIQQLKMVFLERGVPVELLLRSDGHCLFASDAPTLLPEMAVLSGFTDR